MSDCIFCKIVAKEIPSTIVYEDNDMMAFKDINPAAPVHILLVPKKHMTSLDEMQSSDQALIGRMMYRIHLIAAEAGLSDGYRVVINTGEAVGQTVLHLHMHIIGGRDLNWPPG